MSKNSEETDKTREVATWIFPPLTLLLSVPIIVIIVGAWNPIVLEGIRDFIRNSPTIAIITMLSSVCLSSFLLQLFGSVILDWADDSRKKVVAQLKLRPVLLLSALVPALVAVVIPILTVETWRPEPFEFLRALPTEKPIFSFLAGLGLLSLLFRANLHIDPDREDKPWKRKVDLFVLRPLVFVSIPMAVLILSAQIWHPELLNAFTDTVQEKLKIRQLGAITTILASVSLLFLLFQEYLNKEPDNVPKFWKVVACPVHLVLRLVARILAIFAILVTVLTTPLLYIVYVLIRLIRRLFHFIAWLLLFLSILFPVLLLIYLEIPFSDFISRSVNDDLEILNLSGLIEETVTRNIVLVPSVLISIGVLSLLLKESACAIWDSLSRIKTRIVGFIVTGWRPTIELRDSLSVTWRCFVYRLCPSVRSTFNQSRKFYLAILTLYVTLFCGLLSVIQLELWQSNVSDKLKAIEELSIPRFIFLSSTEPSPTYLFEKGAQISLIHPIEGDLYTLEGICPDGVNEAWLGLFKEAVRQCAGKDTTRIRVRGFASIAPVTKRGTGDTTKSPIFNNEIANRRAQAILYFLQTDTYNKDKCVKALKNGWQFEPKDSNPTRLKLTYESWNTYEQMSDQKPVNDGSSANRKRDLEFLNRTVQIIIEDGGCLSNQVEKPTNSNEGKNGSQKLGIVQRSVESYESVQVLGVQRVNLETSVVKK